MFIGWLGLRKKKMKIKNRIKSKRKRIHYYKKMGLFRNYDGPQPWVLNVSNNVTANLTNIKLL